MITIPENLASANKALAEKFLALTNTAFTNTERLAALNLNFARSILEDGVANAMELFSAKDPQRFVALQTSFAQPAVEKVMAYSRSAYEIATQAQEDVAKLVEEQFADISNNVAEALDKAAKSAPVGSDGAISAVKSALAAANSAYENISKAGKQAAEIIEANFSAASKLATKTAAAAKPKKAA